MHLDQITTTRTHQTCLICAGPIHGDDTWFQAPPAGWVHTENRHADHAAVVNPKTTGTVEYREAESGCVRCGRLDGTDVTPVSEDHYTDLATGRRTTLVYWRHTDCPDPPVAIHLDGNEGPHTLTDSLARVLADLAPATLGGITPDTTRDHR